MTHTRHAQPVGADHVPNGRKPYASPGPHNVDHRRDWTWRWTAITSLLAWVLANGLDVFSVLVIVQGGGRLAFARYHVVAPAAAAEAFLIYSGMRVLSTLALALGVVSVGRRWPSTSRAACGALTACALATAATAWWRIYR